MSDLPPEGVRQCRDCGEIKPLSQFHVSPRRAAGRGSYCKPCYNVRSKKSYAKRVADKFGREVKQRAEVPDGHRFCPDCQAIKPLSEYPRNKRGREGYGTYCKPCHNARGRASLTRRGGSRHYHLMRRYGIGEKEFQELLAAQGGVCAICGTENPQHVDHDHLTGYVRGVLCFNCNGGLGHFRDDVKRMTKATGYLMTTASWTLERPGVYRVLSPQRGTHPMRRVVARPEGLRTPAGSGD